MGKREEGGREEGKEGRRGLCTCVHDGIAVAEELVRKEVSTQALCSHAGFRHIAQGQSPPLQIIPHM